MSAAAVSTLFAVVFVVSMELGHLTRESDSPLALAWPAAGVSAVWIVWAAQRHRFGIDATALVVVCTAVNVLNGIEALPALAFGGVNLLHGVLAAAVLQAGRGTAAIQAVLDLRAAVVVGIASIAGGAASALAGGVVASLAFGEELTEGFAVIAVRNSLSCFAVVIAVVGLKGFVREWRSRRLRVVLVAAVAVLGAVCVFVSPAPVAFWVVPLAVVVATRCGPEATSVVILLQGTAVVALTAAGRGPLQAIGSDEHRALVALSLVAVLVGVGLALSISNLGRDVALEASQSDRLRLRQFMDAAPVASAHVATGGGSRHLMDHNPALNELLAGRDVLAGADPLTWFSAADRAALERAWTEMLLTAAWSDHAGWRGQVRLDAAYGGGFVDLTMGVVQGRPGGPEALVSVKMQMIDVTAQRLAEEQLEHAALHDALTGLGNRVLLGTRLSREFEGGALSERTALLYIDVDHFKAINDQRGHAVGDAVLVEIARRIREAVRSDDVAARIGGDEFIVLCRDVDEEEAHGLAQRVLRHLARPIASGETVISPSVSVGIAHAQLTEPADPDAFLRAADAALYTAKETGRGRAAYYAGAGDSRPVRSAPRIPDLRLHYQLINDTDTGRPCAVEALVRWQHPVRGVLGPAHFLAEIDGTPAMRDLGAFVLEQSLQDLAGMLVRRGMDLHVNVSSVELADDTFTARVLAALESHDLEPGRLVLEITESHAVGADHVTRATLADLHAAGVRFAVDDFGTGYNSLGYLMTLPIDIIKLDRSFVSAIADGPAGDAVARGVREIADRLGLALIAEGVEEGEQLDTLRGLGYRRLQGFYSDVPRPWSQLREELAGA